MKFLDGNLYYELSFGENKYLCYNFTEKNENDLKKYDQIKYILMVAKCTQIIACAGSGKTTTILNTAKECAEKSKLKSSVLILTYSRNSKNDFCSRLIDIGFQKFISTDQVLTIHSISQSINNKVEGGQCIDSFIEFCIIKATKYIQDFPEQCKQVQKLKKVQNIFIDEAQDLSEIQFNFVKSLASLLDCNIFFVGDPCQCIYQFQGAQSYLMYKIPFLFQTSQIESKQLNVNYRSQKKIIELANQLRLEQSICGNLEQQQNIPKIFLEDKDTYLDSIIRTILQSAKNVNGNLNFDNVAVIGSLKCGKNSGNLGLQQIRNKLVELKVPMRIYYKLDEEGSSDKQESLGEGLNLLTIHSSKGMEFETVILIDFHFALMNRRPSKSEYEEIHKNLFYVAITRAKQNLIIFARLDKITPLFIDIYDRFEIQVSQQCKFRDFQIQQIIQSINCDSFEEEIKQATSVTELVKQITVQQTTKSAELQQQLMEKLQPYIEKIDTVTNIQSKQLGDFCIPLGIVAEYIANYSLLGQQFIDNIIDFYKNQVLIQIDSKQSKILSNDSSIIIYSKQELELLITNQKIKLKHQDNAYISEILTQGKTVRICKQNYKYLINSLKILEENRDQDLDTLYKIFYEIAVADFVEQKNADHIYSEDYLQYYESEKENLKLIPKRLKSISAKQCMLQVPIFNQQLKISGLIDLVTDDYLVEFKYKDNLTVQDYLQLLLYGLIYDPNNVKKRVLINLKNEQLKIISLTEFVEFNKMFLFAILDISGKKLINSGLIYDFETTVIDDFSFPDPKKLDITDRFIYDHNFKFAVSDGLIKQAFNGNIINNSYRATQITGISNKLLTQYGQNIDVFGHEIQQIQKYYNNPCFIAHYPYCGFDNILINRYMCKFISEFEYRTVNTLRVFKQLQKQNYIQQELVDFKLQTIYKAIVDQDYIQNHRAKEDVMMIVNLFDVILGDQFSDYIYNNSEQQSLNQN